MFAILVTAHCARCVFSRICCVDSVTIGRSILLRPQRNCRGNKYYDGQIFSLCVVWCFTHLTVRDVYCGLMSVEDDFPRSFGQFLPNCCTQSTRRLPSSRWPPENQKYDWATLRAFFFLPRVRFYSEGSG